MQFVENLKELRERRGISQTEFARRARARGLPFHQPTVQRIEQGQRPLRLTEAIELASELGTTMQALLNDMSLAQSYDSLARVLDPAMIERGFKYVSDGIRHLRFIAREIDEELDGYESTCQKLASEPDPAILRHARDVKRTVEKLIEEIEPAEANVPIYMKVVRAGRDDYPHTQLEPLHGEHPEA